jgi:hypothetical protein
MGAIRDPLRRLTDFKVNPDRAQCQTEKSPWRVRDDKYLFTRSRGERGVLSLFEHRVHPFGTLSPRLRVSACHRFLPRTIFSASRGQHLFCPTRAHDFLERHIDRGGKSAAKRGKGGLCRSNFLAHMRAPMIPPSSASQPLPPTVCVPPEKSTRPCGAEKDVHSLRASASPRATLHPASPHSPILFI